MPDGDIRLAPTQVAHFVGRQHIDFDTGRHLAELLARDIEAAGFRIEHE